MSNSSEPFNFNDAISINPDVANDLALTIKRDNSQAVIIKEANHEDEE